MLAFALGPALAGAATNYWRITADRVTVIAADSAEHCTRLAMELIVFEHVLRQMAGWDSDYQPPPIALYALSQQDARRFFLSDSERKEELITNMQIFSKYLPGADYNIAAIVDNGSGDEATQSALFLYAEGLLVAGPTRRDAPWYQLGVANLLNGALIRADSSVLLNRNLEFEAGQESNSSSHEPYDLARLLRTSTDELNGGAVDMKAFVRGARDWAQFGLLTGEERRKQYRELAILMRQGSPADDAVKDAFGVSLQELAARFVAGSWRKDAQYRIPAPAQTAHLPSPIKLEGPEAETLLKVLASRALAERPRKM
jgi:hypothetical protein